MIPELLSKYGFTFTRSCHCNGAYTEKFRFGNYELHWRKKRYKARLFENRNAITAWFMIDQLENYLHEYIQSTEEPA